MRTRWAKRPAVNRLADETSPYLRQHRDNPVDWYPWGPDAFAAARERDVPVLLSVGYSACHWCHVMAHESFEDDDVAAAMNDGFVSIKVDREERPDVDAIYMDAVQAMTGRGGWPMTVFLTADGDPFFGGTYFPKTQVPAADRGDRRRVAQPPRRARRRTPTRSREAISPHGAAASPLTTLPGVETVNAPLQALAQAFDPEWGGFGAAPKFPSTMSLDLVLRGYLRRGDRRRREMVTTSLDAMASGGMYDHIGGGFARYSVDREWLVPHFEKMLYDQALLVRVYPHAARRLGTSRVAPGRRRDDRVRAARPAPGGRWLLLGRGRRLARRRRARPRGPVPRGRRPRWPRSSTTDAGRTSPPLVRHHRRQLRGRSIPNRLTRLGDWARPPHRGRPPATLRGRAAAPPGPRRQDPHRVERAVAVALADAGAAPRAVWNEAAADAVIPAPRASRDDGHWHRSWQADG